MNIAITGASGFIGKNLQSFFQENDDINLISITRSPTPKDYEYSYEDFFNGNIKVQIDYFIHLASPNFDFCKDDSLYDGIVVLTRDILNSLKKYNCKNFIFFSSCKVYGESSLESINFDELSNLRPVSDYAKAKISAEKLVSKLSEEKNINYLIYRLPFVYGKGMKSNIGSLLRLVDKSFPIILFKNGANLKKSFLCIENIIETIHFNLMSPSSINNNLYNLTDLEPIGLDEFILRYKKLKRSKSFIIWLPEFVFNLFMKIPLIKTILVRVFGNFNIKNSKIKSCNSNLLSTPEGIANLVTKNNI